MNKRFYLPLALLIAGGFVIFIHDYAYRRVDSGTGDYELGGLVTHAGVDMIVLTGILAFVAAIWPGDRR